MDDSKKISIPVKGVVIFATADFDHPFWTNKQYTAVQFAEAGCDVLYVESFGLRAPTSGAKDLKRMVVRIFRFLCGPRKVRPNLWVWSPLPIPFHRYAWIRKLNQYWLKITFWDALFSMGFRSKAFRWADPSKLWFWTYHPVLGGILENFKPQKWIYHSVDDLRAAPGIDGNLIQAEEQKLYSHLSKIFCTSRTLESRYQHEWRAADVHYFGNVIHPEPFLKQVGNPIDPEDMKGIPHPRIGFVGALSEYKFDVAEVLKVAMNRPDWHWVLIGEKGEGQPGSDLSKLEGLLNVHFLGPKKYEHLPQYLSRMDVLTIPCPVNEYTQSMFPMKFFEYLISRKPVVARRIESLKEHEDVFFPYEAGGLSVAIEKAFSARQNQQWLDAGQQRAHGNTYEKRFLGMMGVLKP